MSWNTACTDVNVVVRDVPLSKKNWAGAFSRSIPHPFAGIFPSSFSVLSSLLCV